MSTAGSIAYFIMGLIYFIISFLSLVSITKCINDYTVKTFNKTNKYGSYIGKVLFVAAIIRVLMDITMIRDSFLLDSSYHYVFEGFEFCQELLYLMIILFVGGIYDEQKYDNKCFKTVMWISIVCVIK